MFYQQAIIPVHETDAEAFSDALMDCGALSSAIEDAFAGTENEQAIFGEPDMPQQQIWQQSRVMALFDAEVDVAAALFQAATSVGMVLPDYVVEKLEERDWVRLTQSQFEPIKISDRFWITPTWHEMPDDNAVNLRLDPGLAFGTGSHPTTHLCLQWLDGQLLGGKTVLDYGCGSGILTIAALKLGAVSAVGVDIDPQAIRASCDNAVLNEVAADFYLPDALPQGQFDVVIANILANPLRMLGEMLAGRTKKGGRIVLSGILVEQLEEMTEIYAQWFDMQPSVSDGGWVCLSGIKR
ncbi:MAG: 50S ribosomal protein L11 methyltransferase [Alysiella sp.]|uniref:50S ribosomal protein L11 methyltransferase n=1 Tax=Alysiella sp. TaxID=1872483 RepID=UPI0026DA911C|nr:50S ribosomal protein L11 methyltransferase [Alysiella sp.]MDO4434638.1 50S ribosomal protein L11 methyltransferase [Alysiella sp.]